MTEFSTCEKCNYDSVPPTPTCPQCGKRTRTSRQIRRLGWFLLVIGLFLVGGMSALTAIVASMVYQKAAPGASPNFTGTPEQAMLIFGLFGFIIVFGLVAM